jgi:hypothetical protein
MKKSVYAFLVIMGLLLVIVLALFITGRIVCKRSLFY